MPARPDRRASAYVPHVQYNVPPPPAAPRYASTVRRCAGGDGSAAAVAREERVGAVVAGLPFHTDYYAPVLRAGRMLAIDGAAAGDASDADSDGEAAGENADPDPAGEAGFRATRERIAGGRTLMRELEERRARGAVPCIQKMVDAHLHVLAGISAMQVGDAQVVHFDLKSDRLMYDAARGLPAITGFGVAFRLPDVDPGSAASLRANFYACADEYAPWCVDVALLAHIATRALADGGGRAPDDAVTEDDAAELRAVCERYTQNNRMFTEGHYTPAQTAAFAAAAGAYAAGLRGQTWRAAATDLLLGWRSWDVYSLCVIYRRALGALFADTFVEGGADPAAKSASFWVSGYVALLETALLAPPGGALRASPEQMAAAVAAGAASLARSDAALAA